MLGQAKPFDSLSGGLLARKGAARPAMRPQGYASLAPTAQQLEDLGWDDMGADAAPDVPADGAPAAAEKPAVLVARDALVEAVAVQAVAAPVEVADVAALVEAADVVAPIAVHPVSVATASRLSRETAHKGRAAFTLRLDAGRHLQLRLASALAHRSSQQLVADALDHFLTTMPEVDALIAQLPAQTLTPSKGKRR